MDFAQLMRREFAVAKRCWHAIIVLQGAAVALAVMTPRFSGRQAVFVQAAIALAIPLLTFILKEVAGAHHSHGERARRVLLLRDGLGREPSTKDCLEIEAQATALSISDLAPIGSYYNSPLPIGPQRLAHIIEESAYYTCHVARAAARVNAAVAAAGVIGMVIALWYAVALLADGNISADMAAPQYLATQLARITPGILIYFAAGMFAASWRSFSTLSRTAEKTLERCDALRAGAETTAEEVLVAMSTYDCAVAKAPPLPTWLYRIKRRKLEASWAQHMASRGGPTVRYVSQHPQ